ncbi:unnamed protein product, partial [Ectocarpus sp. 8 AP-2014]
RSADTARVAEVITCGFTPHPGGHGEEKVRKTGFGSVDAVAHRHFEDPSEAVRSLKAAGAFVCALETTDNASSLFDLEEGGVVALVLGNEVTGVDERVLGLCDLVVEVPVFGLKNSLNVASAGTVVLY